MRFCKECDADISHYDVRSQFCTPKCKGKYNKRVHRERNRNERRRLNTNYRPILDDLLRKPWTTVDFYQNLSKNW